MNEVDVALDRIRELRDRRRTLAREADRVSRSDLDSDPPVRYSKAAHRAITLRQHDVYAELMNALRDAAELGAGLPELVAASGLLANDVLRETDPDRAAD